MQLRNGTNWFIPTQNKLKSILLLHFTLAMKYSYFKMHSGTKLQELKITNLQLSLRP